MGNPNLMGWGEKIGPKPEVVDPQIKADAAWLARLARGSSWPGEMAQRVEDAASRVQDWAEG